jgi:hypothetical protein
MEADPETQLTLAKEWAKAKFQASQARPQDIARARLDATRWWSQSRMQEYRAGRGTLDFMLSKPAKLFSQH